MSSVVQPFAFYAATTASGGYEVVLPHEAKERGIQCVSYMNGEPVIPKAGSERAHHFAFHPGSNLSCGGGGGGGGGCGESDMHRFCKKFVAQRIKSLIFEKECVGCSTLFVQGGWAHATEEFRIGKYVADVGALNDAMNTASVVGVIEIKHTHATQDEKENYLTEMLGYDRYFELNAVDVFKAAQNLVTTITLRHCKASLCPECMRVEDVKKQFDAVCRETDIIYRSIENEESAVNAEYEVVIEKIKMEKNKRLDDLRARYQERVETSKEREREVHARVQQQRRERNEASRMISEKSNDTRNSLLAAAEKEARLQKLNNLPPHIARLPEEEALAYLDRIHTNDWVCWRCTGEMFRSPHKSPVGEVICRPCHAEIKASGGYAGHYMFRGIYDDRPVGPHYNKWSTDDLRKAGLE